jgi:tetratricopeptide (TPR) repeat protein
MDLISIAAGLGMMFGLLTADAVVSAETVAVQISVPASVAQTGYSEDVVEQIFTHEFEAMNQTRSLLRPPVMRPARQPTIVGVIATSLRLDNFTAALQDLLGLERMRIAGAVVAGAPGEGQRLLINSSSAYSGPFSLDLSERGETDRLLRRAALETMERVQPYRAALFHFGQVTQTGGNDYSAVVQLAERELGRPRRAEVLEERSFLENLLGIVALLNNDLDEAERRFRLSFSWNPSFTIGRINLAFVHVERDRYQDAIDILKPLIASTSRRRFPLTSTRFGPLQEAMHSTLGVALWAQGDLDGAEAAFSRATREYPSSAGAYSYWARLLRERGDTVRAAEKAEVARLNALTFENYPEVANLYFWMSPRDNQPLVRRVDVPFHTR